MYYAQESQKALQQLKTDRNGLSDSEALKRLETDGANELREGKKERLIKVFLSQFADLLVIILMASALISLLTGNGDSTIVILCVITMNAILGTVQHFKAQKSIDSLKAMSAPTAKVVRGGNVREIPARELVCGDIMLLEAGNIAGADGRVIEAASFMVNESSLTGESLPVEKTDCVISTKDGTQVMLGDRVNMVYSGTQVTGGRGTVVVTDTGMNTEIGKIAGMISSAKRKKTPLQKSLDAFSKTFSLLIIVICAIVMALTMLRGEDIVNSLMFAVALAVAAIPEALSSIVTISLAIGTQKMAKQNAIVKELKAVEGLGCVSIICSDKTGTLTQNRMTVQKLFCSGETLEPETEKASVAVLLQAMILCNDAVCTENGTIGDPTETALLDCCSADKCRIERDRYPRLSEIPFDSDRKLMSTLHNIGGKYIMLTKGAVDVLLPHIRYICENGIVRDITGDDIWLIQKSNMEFSEKGMRVLCFSKKEINSQRSLDMSDEDEYIFIGLTAMTDPPRKESTAAVAECIRAGIKPIMITGDHKTTATAIAKQVGIFRNGDIALDGAELEQMNDEELSGILSSVSVYARVAPAHKIRIVNLWQNSGHIVAMTGDGVNDAPALKKADIGVAMGITGTQVSKDAASIILTDDNFATIVKSVANGRTIYANIKNAVKFLISGNTAGIITVLYSVVLALPLPFTAVHLLFINLLTDSLPAIAMSMESADGVVMKSKPRKSDEGILDKPMIISILSQATLLAIATIVGYSTGLCSNPTVASTMAFATLCLARLFGMFNCRSSKPLTQIGFKSNPFSLAAFFAGIFFLSAALFIPPLQVLLNVEPLNVWQLLSVSGLALAPTLIIQFFKIIKYRIKNKKA